MNLAAIGCKTMKDGVIVSSIFLIFAVIFILIAKLVIPNIAYVSALTLALGILMLLIAPLILIGSYLKTVRYANGAECRDCKEGEKP